MDLYIVPARGGGNPVRLTELSEDEPHAVWLDSSTIAFMGAQGFFTLKIDSEGKPLGPPARIGGSSRTGLRSGSARHAVLTYYNP